MSEPSVLFVKPGSVNKDDRAALREIGVVLVEVDDPSEPRFVRPAAEVSSTDMLGAAIAAIDKAGCYSSFGEAVSRMYKLARKAATSAPAKRDGEERA